MPVMPLPYFTFSLHFLIFRASTICFSIIKGFHCTFLFCVPDPGNQIKNFRTTCKSEIVTHMLFAFHDLNSPLLPVKRLLVRESVLNL